MNNDKQCIYEYESLRKNALGEVTRCCGYAFILKYGMAHWCQNVFKEQPKIYNNPRSIIIRKMENKFMLPPELTAVFTDVFISMHHQAR